MDRVYRGYPQPYMLLNREESSSMASPAENRRRLRTEFDYFQGLYPLETRKIQRVVDEELDRFDEERSPIYDEYPDREFLYQLRDIMFTKALAEGMAAEQDLVQVLMLQSVLERRLLAREARTMERE